MKSRLMTRNHQAAVISQGCNRGCSRGGWIEVSADFLTAKESSPELTPVSMNPRSQKHDNTSIPSASWIPVDLCEVFQALAIR